eukprot:gene29491-5837_t
MNNKLETRIEDVSSQVKSDGSKIKCLASSACSNRKKVGEIRDDADESAQKIGLVEGDLSNFGIVMDGKLTDVGKRIGKEAQKVNTRFGQEAQKVNTRFGQEAQKVNTRFGKEAEKVNARFRLVEGDLSNFGVVMDEELTDVGERICQEAQKVNTRFSQKAQKVNTRFGQEAQKVKTRFGQEAQKIDKRFVDVQGTFTVVKQKIQHTESSVSTINSDMNTLRKSIDSLKKNSDVSHSEIDKIITQLKLLVSQTKCQAEQTSDVFNAQMAKQIKDMFNEVTLLKSQGKDVLTTKQLCLTSGNRETVCIDADKLMAVAANASKGTTGPTGTPQPLPNPIKPVQSTNCTVSAWGACSMPCAGGVQTRTVTQSANNGGTACPILSQACNTQACPVKQNCAVSAWGACSMPCAGGVQTRTVTQNATNGGAACPILTQACNTQACPVKQNCAVSAWGACSMPCAGGVQTRTVTQNATNGGAACPTLSQACNTQACGGGVQTRQNPPIVQNCAESGWGACSMPCAGGVQTRTVTQNATNGGAGCPTLSQGTTGHINSSLSGLRTAALHNNMTPFFRGSAPPGTDYSDDGARGVGGGGSARLEMFTGREGGGGGMTSLSDGKRETGALFKAAPFMSGTSASAMDHVRKTYMDKMQLPRSRANELPFKQEIVGRPGVRRGKTGDVYFDERELTLPPTIDNLRSRLNQRETYEGRFIPGSSATTSTRRPDAQPVLANKLPSLLREQRTVDDFIRTTGGVTAGALHPTYEDKVTERQSTSARAYAGLGVRPSAVLRGKSVDPTARARTTLKEDTVDMGDNDKRNMFMKTASTVSDADAWRPNVTISETMEDGAGGGADGGVSGSLQHTKTGAYTISSLDPARPTQKAMLSDTGTRFGAMSQDPTHTGGYTPAHTDRARETMRNTMVDNDYYGTQAGSSARHVNSSHEAYDNADVNCDREMAVSTSREHIGSAAKVASSQWELGEDTSEINPLREAERGTEFMIPDCPIKLNPAPHVHSPLTPMDTQAGQPSLMGDASSYTEHRLAQDVRGNSTQFGSNPFIHDITRGIHE